MRERWRPGSVGLSSVGLLSAGAGPALPSGAALCGCARPEPGPGLDWEAGTRRAGLLPPGLRVTPAQGSGPACGGALCRGAPPCVEGSSVHVSAGVQKEPGHSCEPSRSSSQALFSAQVPAEQEVWDGAEQSWTGAGLRARGKALYSRTDSQGKLSPTLRKGKPQEQGGVCVPDPFSRGKWAFVSSEMVVPAKD